MAEDHFDVISNINGFTCINDDHHKSEYSKCKACKSKTKCEITQTKISCIKCHRQFNSKTCFDNHITNKKCAEYSYMCIHCHRFYKTRDLKPEEHRCDEVKCGNCKQFVPIKDHQCYMLKKDIKPHSENYICLLYTSPSPRDS